MIRQPKGLITYYTMVSDISYLYSEGERDPVIIARMDAERLCFDRIGNSKLWEIEVLPIPVNKVEIRILIFKNSIVHSRWVYEKNRD